MSVIVPDFDVGAGITNSGPSACVANVLLTEPSPVSLYKERYYENMIWGALGLYPSRKKSLRTVTMSICIDLLNHEYVSVKPKDL